MPPALPTDYALILNDLNRDVIRARPADPLQFCANWFNQRLEQQRVQSRAASGLPSNPILADTPTTTTRASPAPTSTAAQAPVMAPGSLFGANPFGGGSAPPVVARHDASPSAINDDSMGDDEGGGGASGAFLPPPTFNMGRRTSVSAESLDPSTSSANGGADGTSKPIPLPKFPKTDSQLQRIRDSIVNNLLFRNLEEDQYRDVLGAMQEVQIPAHHLVIEQGAQGDFFYIVESGALDVYIRDPGTSTPSAESSDSGAAAGSTSGGAAAAAAAPANLAELGSKKVSYGPGSSFGELALLYAQPRAASIVSTSPCILWSLDRVTFRSILMETNSRRRALYEAFLADVPLFEHLSPAERAKISDALDVRVYDVGQSAIQQGERGTEFFIILEGNAEVRKRKSAAAAAAAAAASAGDAQGETTIGRLGKGDYFGELALLNNAPRAASIVAATRLRVALLSEQAFTRLLGPLAGIMGRHAAEHYAVPEAAVPANVGGADLPVGGPGGEDDALPGVRNLAHTGMQTPVAPHDASRATVPGEGTWVGGLGASPFGFGAQA